MPDSSRLAQQIQSLLRDVPDFPIPGVTFKDITPVIQDGPTFAGVIDNIAGRHQGQGLDMVAGIEARGFIFGGAVARLLGVGFLSVRKAGKLPGPVIGLDYALEYGTARIEIPSAAIASGARILVIDDVLATGGTAAATCALIAQAGGEVAAVETIIELTELGGRERLAEFTLRAALQI